MNIKRFIFWFCFVVLLGLIVWGLIAANNKPASTAVKYGDAPAVVSTDHILGPVTAKVTLIEYGDFQCPACAAYAPLVERLVAEEATGTIRVIFRHFPLPQHTNAIGAAQASEAAATQGKFWEMYKLIYANQTTWENDKPDVARTEFEGYAAQLGLDKQKFITDMDSSSTKKVIDGGKAEAQTLALDYTPTFYVNGKVVTNPQGYEAFKALIDAAAK
jgi:protein-disulfide isomerase